MVELRPFASLGWGSIVLLLQNSNSVASVKWMRTLRRWGEGWANKCPAQAGGGDQGYGEGDGDGDGDGTLCTVPYGVPSVSTSVHNGRWPSEQSGSKKVAELPALLYRAIRRFKRTLDKPATALPNWHQARVCGWVS